MSALENDILQKYRHSMAAHGAPQLEPPSEDLYVHEWTNEDEYASYRTYWELGGIFDDDYQNLDDIYSYVA